MRLVGLLLFVALFSFTRGINIDVTTIDGSGSSIGQRFMWKVASTLSERSRLPLRITYRASGSVQGTNEFVGSDNGGVSDTDYGVSDIPIPANTYSSMPQGRVTAQVPFMVGPIALYHSVPDAGSLSLSPCLIARIFTRNILTWDHPDILAANPTLIVPPGQPIIVIRRKDSCASTTVLTQYLNAACPASWPYGVSPPDSFWSTQGFMMVTGISEMVSDIQTNTFSIGYAIPSLAANVNLQEISLTNAAGVTMTSSMADYSSVVQAAQASPSWPSSITGDFSSVSLVNTQGPNSWPMIVMTYVFVDVSELNDNSNPDVGGRALVKALVDYVTSSEGQSLASYYGFYQLPPSLLSWVQTQWASTISSSAFAANEMFVFEGTLPQTTGGQSNNTLSALRRDYYSTMLEQLAAEVASLKAQIVGSLTRTVDGSGSALFQMVIGRVAQAMMDMSRPPIRVTYRAIGTLPGYSEFVNQAGGFQPVNHFAAADMPLPAANYSALQQAGISVIQVPVFGVAVNFFHSIPSIVLGEARLNLTACALAQIFTGQITSWDDAAIAQSNPSANFTLATPQELVITVYYPSEPSSTTLAVASYLNSACPASFTQTPDLTITWPAAATFTAAPGADLPDLMHSTTSAITYFAYTDLDDDDLLLEEVSAHEVALSKFSDPTQFRTFSEASITAALASRPITVFPANPRDDFSGATLAFMNSPDDASWPLTLMAYVFIRTDVRSYGLSGPVLQALVQFILGSGQSLLPEFRLGQLPNGIQNYALNALSYLILDPSSDRFLFEQSATVGAGAAVNVLSAQRASFLTKRLSQLDTAVQAAMAIERTNVFHQTMVTNDVTNVTNVTAVTYTTTNLTQVTQVTNVTEVHQVIQNITKGGDGAGVAGLLFALLALALSIAANATNIWLSSVVKKLDKEGEATAGGVKGHFKEIYAVKKDEYQTKMTTLNETIKTKADAVKTKVEQIQAQRQQGAGGAGGAGPSSGGAPRGAPGNTPTTRSPAPEGTDDIEQAPMLGGGPTAPV